MTTVLHVPVVEWQPTEAIARSVMALAGALDGVTSSIVANDLTGLPAGRFDVARAIPGWAGRLPLTRDFARVVREVDPDVVHLHGGALTPALSAAPALAGRVVVASCYSPAEPDALRQVARRAREYRRSSVGAGRTLVTAFGGMQFARRMLREGRTAVVCTPDDRVREQFEPAGPVVLVRGAADVPAAAARWSETPTVVFAGRAEQARGIDDLVAAFATVHTELPTARLRLLLLPGAEAARWQAQLASVPYIDLTIGAVPDLTAAFLDAQVAAFPFRWSATVTPALAAAEAMAAGLPLVATDVDCLRPLVPRDTDGYLVPVGDVHALATAIIDALQDPVEWQARSLAARASISAHWSWSRAAAETERAYALARGLSVSQSSFSMLATSGKGR